MSGVVTRRALLALGGAGAAITALPAFALEASRPSSLAIRSGGDRYAAALDAIRLYADAELAAVGLPGMTLSLVDADGFTATMCLGWADVDRRIAVRPDHRFEIGSISKSITAITIYRLVEQGKIDLAAPVSRYLPDVPLPPAPITIAQLLDHTAGLPHDAPVFPRSPGGRLWTGFVPGTRFSYSNIGYTLLGLVIAAVTGRPHPAVIAEEVLSPLGIADAAAAIHSADRARLATGYVPFRDDIPALTGATLIPGPWTEEDLAAGAVVASGDAMAGYLRYVLALGRGMGGPLLSDATARLILANDVAAPDFGPEARYAGGFAKVPVGGRTVLHHTGGMILFSSAYHADPIGGVACFASVNAALGAYRPRRTTAFAIQALRAAREGKPLPAIPDPAWFQKIEKPSAYTGRWIAADGTTIDLRPQGKAIALFADGVSARVEQSDDDTLATDHSRLAPHLLRFERTRGSVSALWWGGTLFGRTVAPVAVAPAPRLVRVAGRYVSHDPWSGSASIVVAGDSLIAEGVGEIVERPGGFWSGKEDPGGVDRVWFDAPVNGRTTRLCVNGADLLRLV